MTESATSLREQKRWQTSRRITLCALRLTAEHGLDGYTVEDLADAAEVSRRTLFNYFPSKVDAVLGEHPDLPPDALVTFLAGGPHGNLLEDVAELARAALAATPPDRETAELGRRVLLAHSRLLTAAHERFQDITQDLAAYVTEREGAEYGAERARLLLRLVLTLFDSALDVFVEEGETRSLVEIFDEQLRAARALFA
jgi:AcrR family transcriptional regulator